MGSKGDQQSWSEVPEEAGTLGNENRYETLIPKNGKKLKKKKKKTFQKDSKKEKKNITVKP